MQVKEEIRRFLTEKLLYIDDGFEYNDDTSFISEGLIDSTGIMELVAFVRSAFGITVDPQDLTPDNFDSINQLAAFINRRSEPSCATMSRTAAILPTTGFSEMGAARND